MLANKSLDLSLAELVLGDMLCRRATFPRARLEKKMIYSYTQVPHTMSVQLSECDCLPEARFRLESDPPINTVYFVRHPPRIT